jgi:hypothetical protein
MEAAERDTTDEWRIAPGRAPATIAELEGRIDVAVATARSAEEAVLEVGAASLEAAEQARRAAALAEKASASALRAAERIGTGAPAATPSAAPVVEAPAAPDLASNGTSPEKNDPFDERIASFQKRAERVMTRLQRLEASEPTSRKR